MFMIVPSIQIHPDRNPTNPMLHDQFVKLNEAYMVLSKPLTRREYDMTLVAQISQHQRMAHTMHGSHTPDSSHKPGSGGPQSASYEWVVYFLQPVECGIVMISTKISTFILAPPQHFTGQLRWIPVMYNGM